MNVPSVPAALSERIKSGQFFHSYIISGGGEETARYIAKAAVCTGEERPCGVCPGCVKADKGLHPDIITVEKDRKEREIGVSTMREVRADAFVMPNEAAAKVYIIKEADTMNNAAQNAMLKILEEPPRSVIFILLAQNPERLLPTVRSRCIEINSAPAEDTEERGDAYELVRLISEEDRVGVFRFVMKLDRMQREEFREFTTQAMKEILIKLREGAGPEKELQNAAAAFSKAREYIEANVSLVHVTGMLMAELAVSEGEKT